MRTVSSLVMAGAARAGGALGDLSVILGCFALVAFMPVGAFIVMIAVTSLLCICAAYNAGLKV